MEFPKTKQRRRSGLPRGERLSVLMCCQNPKGLQLSGLRVSHDLLLSTPRMSATGVPRQLDRERPNFRLVRDTPGSQIDGHRCLANEVATDTGLQAVPTVRGSLRNGCDNRDRCATATVVVVVREDELSYSILGGFCPAPLRKWRWQASTWKKKGGEDDEVSWKA